MDCELVRVESNMFGRWVWEGVCTHSSGIENILTPEIHHSGGVGVGG